MTSPPSPEEIAQAHQILYQAGLALRTQVAGEAYVSRSLEANANPFSQPMQELLTEAGWAQVWTRPGLERKTRSLLNIAMLCATNRGVELAVHVRGAVNNGASEVEIRETLLQAAVYCGMPAGIEGFRVATKVLEDMKQEKEQTS